MTRSDNPSPAARQPRSDLTEQVRLAISAEPRVNPGPGPLHVLSRQGQLVLAGWVPTLRDKRLSATIATRFAGQVPVVDQLFVGPPDRFPDAEILRHVQDALEEDRWLDSTAIQVATRDGIVRLRGTVQTAVRALYAAALCWWVPGARGVINELTWREPEPDANGAVGGAIQVLFDKDPLVDPTEIALFVQDGVVTLGGAVAGEDARTAAENDAWAVEGVRDVANQIVVVPGPDLH